MKLFCKKSVEYIIEDFIQLLMNFVGNYVNNPRDVLLECFGVDPSKFQMLTNPIDVATEQADAFIDIIYYIYNALVKKGYSLQTEEPYALDCVREFTEQSMECTFGPHYENFTLDEVKFIVKMVLSEIVELSDTVSMTSEESKQLVRNCILNATHFEPNSKVHDLIRVCETCESYFKDMNLNFERLFMVVHSANMAKKNPKTGRFERREDGKILKPEGWQPPNLRNEVVKQMII